MHTQLPSKRSLGRFGKEERGAIAVMAVLVMALFIAVVGAAIDLGMFFLMRANLQNAIDAAALAGSRALVSGPNPGQPAAQAAANQYLGMYGFVNGINGTTVETPAYSQNPLTGVTDRMTVSVLQQYNTYFLKLIGLNTIRMSNAATAEASPGMADIALSLDLTGSMELSGTNDLAQLQRAVTEFVNDVNPNSNNPTGPQIAMAQWAGVKCGWDRNTAPMSNETNINLGPNTWLGSGTTEYVTPCNDDKTVLTNLSMNKSQLLNLAAGTQSVPCGGGMSNCKALQSWNYQAQSTNSSNLAQGMTWEGNSMGGNPTYSGTKEPNAITVVWNSNYYAWSTANGGRNVGSATGNAHKVLVLITDGNDELWPATSEYTGGSNNVDAAMPGNAQADGCPLSTAVTPLTFDQVSAFGCWDRETINLAKQLKLGPDGIANTPDDVEIYTIGFFCKPYSSGWTSQGHQNWCTSKMADTGPEGGHPCPGPWDTTKASMTDNFLYQVSSSSPGTCDHYFPLRKTESLPAVFKEIAGQIARGKLIS